MLLAMEPRALRLSLEESVSAPALLQPDIQSVGRCLFAENGFMGMGIGAAMTGLRPIVEGMNMGFLLLAFNQVGTVACLFCQYLKSPNKYAAAAPIDHNLVLTHSYTGYRSACISLSTHRMIALLSSSDSGWCHSSTIDSPVGGVDCYFSKKICAGWCRVRQAVHGAAAMTYDDAQGFSRSRIHLRPCWLTYPCSACCSHMLLLRRSPTIVVCCTTPVVVSSRCQWSSVVQEVWAGSWEQSTVSAWSRTSSLFQECSW